MANLTVSCDYCNQTRGDEEFYSFEERAKKRPGHVARAHPQRIVRQDRVVMRSLRQWWKMRGRV